MPYRTIFQQSEKWKKVFKEDESSFQDEHISLPSLNYCAAWDLSLPLSLSRNAGKDEF